MLRIAELLNQSRQAFRDMAASRDFRVNCNYPLADVKSIIWTFRVRQVQTYGQMLEFAFHLLPSPFFRYLEMELSEILSCLNCPYQPTVQTYNNLTIPIPSGITEFSSIHHDLPAFLAIPLYCNGRFQHFTFSYNYWFSDMFSYQ